MKKLLLLIAALSLAANAQQKSDDYRKAAEKKAQEITQGLYSTFLSIAFPESKFSGPDEPVTNRFILMAPGKVLNYWDYYPGADYEESLLHQNSSAPEVDVPPSVMDRWFQLADVLPGSDPFTGGDSGYSMATAYETIVSQMDINGIETKTSDAEARYNFAADYLTSLVRDPDDPTKQTTRLTLYDRYQVEYNDRSLELEDAIDQAKRTRHSVEYEVWFQRHYPALNSKVESSYTKWLVFGQKDIVELYKAYMDTSSAGQDLELARMSLRASGVSSLDRTRTVYPVSFEPGNWYKYLLPRQRGPSRDMLLARKSLIQSEMDSLQSMINFASTNREDGQETVDKLRSDLNSANETQQNKTSTALQTKYKCIKEGNGSKSCHDLQQTQEEAVNAAFQKAQVNAEYESAKFLLTSNSQFIGFLGTRVAALQESLIEVEEQLNHTKPFLGNIAESDGFRNLNSVLNATEQALDDSWLEFQFSSDSSHIDEHQKSSSVNVNFGFSVPVAATGFTIGGFFSGGKASADLKLAVDSANLQASGEILRVNIKRPWFKPSIFKNPSLSFIQRDEQRQKNTYVSPGPQTQRQFRKLVGNEGDSLYLLPEYVTSFLLARNIRLQFSGLDASSVSHMAQLSVGGGISGGYGPFSGSAGIGVSKKSIDMTADRTADGMIITLPGVQVLGYYTEVVPLFPRL